MRPDKYITALAVFCMLAAVSGATTVTVPTGIHYYIPVNIVNQQATASPANFQQLVSFNALAVCNAILCSPHLNNTEFFFQNGTVIKSWYESANGLTNNYGSNSFSTSSNIISWVLIPPGNFIPAKPDGIPGSNIIYLGFAANTVNLFSNTVTGEAAWLTSTNGIYDNGNYVFDPGFYSGFYNGICPNSLCTSLPQFVAQFNGASSYISIGTTGLPLGNSPRSAFGWVYYTGGTGQYAFYGYGSNTGSELSTLIIVNGGTRLYFWAGPSGSFYTNIVLTPNTWHFTGYTYSAGATNTLTVYMDGQSQTTDIGTTLSTTLPGVDPADIGRTPNGQGYYFPGSLSNVQLYNASLSAAQVQALYKEGIGGLNVLPTNAISQWQLNGNANDMINTNNGVPTAVVYPLLLQNANTPNNVMPTVMFGNLIYYNQTIPIQPTVSNTSAEVNQYETFTTSFAGGTSPYTYKWIVSNAVTGVPVYTQSFSNSLTTNSLTIQIPANFISNSPLKANVVVTDALPYTSNSAYSANFLVYPAMSVTISPSTTQKIDNGQSVGFNSVATGGANGLTANLIAGYISIPASSLNNLINQITISWWIYPTATVDCIRPLSKGNGYIIYYGGPGGCLGSTPNIIHVYTNGGNTQVSPTSQMLSLNTWYHIIWTYDSTNGGLLYVNGVSQGSAVGAGALTTDTTNPIVLYGGGAISYLSNLQIYNASLSANQVIALYANGINAAPIGTSNVVGWWPLNGNPKDNSGQMDNGVPTAVTYSTLNSRAYQWRSDATSCTGSSNAIAGANTPTYTASPTSNTFYCLSVTDIATTPVTVTSAQTEVVVSPALHSTVWAASQPTLYTEQKQTLTANIVGGTQPYQFLIAVYNQANALMYESTSPFSAATSNAVAFYQQVGWGSGLFTANVYVTDSATSPYVITNSLTYNVVSTLLSCTTPNFPFSPANGIAYALTNTSNIFAFSIFANTTSGNLIIEKNYSYSNFLQSGQQTVLNFSGPANLTFLYANPPLIGVQCSAAQANLSLGNPVPFPWMNVILGLVLIAVSGLLFLFSIIGMKNVNGRLAYAIVSRAFALLLVWAAYTIMVLPQGVTYPAFTQMGSTKLVTFPSYSALSVLPASIQSTLGLLVIVYSLIIVASIGLDLAFGVGDKVVKRFSR